MKSILPANPQPPPIALRLADLRQQLASADPYILSTRVGATYQQIEAGHGLYHLSLWNQSIQVKYPEWIAYDTHAHHEIDLATLALLLYYFATADGAPEAEHWISFSELPDGRFYNHAFQGYTGHELGRVIKDNFTTFQKAVSVAGGVRITQSTHPIGDVAFQFQALPRVPLLYIGWLGDEEFPCSYQILFNANIHHYLPTDVCAILGSMLTRRIIQIGLLDKLV